MTKKSYRNLSCVLAVIAAVCMAIACTFLGFGVKAEAEPFAMVDGASVRYVDGSTGLRFTAKIEKDAYNKLAEDHSDLTFALYVMPYDYVAKYGELNEENLFGSNAVYGFGASTDKVRIMEFKWAEGLSDVREDGYYLSGAITGINRANYDRQFCARACYSYADGDDTVYVFTAKNGYKNVRSVAEVSEAAIKDIEKEYSYTQQMILGDYVSLSSNTETQYVQATDGKISLSDFIDRTYAAVYLDNEPAVVTDGKIEASNGRHGVMIIGLGNAIYSYNIFVADKIIKTADDFATTKTVEATAASYITNQAQLILTIDGETYTSAQWSWNFTENGKMYVSKMFTKGDTYNKADCIPFVAEFEGVSGVTDVANATKITVTMPDTYWYDGLTGNEYVVLANDIDLSDRFVFGSKATIKGTFDGDGHKITGARTAWHSFNSSAYYSSIIAYINQGTIKNLVIEDAEIGFNIINGSSAGITGGLVFHNKASGVIENVVLSAKTNCAGETVGTLMEQNYGTVKNSLVIDLGLNKGSSYAGTSILGIPGGTYDNVIVKTVDARVSAAKGGTEEIIPDGVTKVTDDADAYKAAVKGLSSLGSWRYDVLSGKAYIGNTEIARFEADVDVITKDRQYVRVTENKGTVELGFDASSVTAVSISGTPVTYTANGNALVVDMTDRGSYTLRVTAESGVYEIPVTFADKIISTADDFIKLETVKATSATYENNVLTIVVGDKTYVTGGWPYTRADGNDLYIAKIASEGTYSNDTAIAFIAKFAGITSVSNIADATDITFTTMKDSTMWYTGLTGNEYVVLADDIDLSDRFVFGNNTVFGGTFDGAGHKITGARTIYHTQGGNWSSLIVATNNGTIKDLTVENAVIGWNVKSASYTGLQGGLVQTNGANGVIDNVYFSASMYYGHNNVGLFIKENKGTVKNSTVVDSGMTCTASSISTQNISILGHVNGGTYQNVAVYTDSDKIACETSTSTTGYTPEGVTVYKLTEE